MLQRMAIFKTGNGERGTGNGERGTGNGERGTGNGERGTGNDIFVKAFFISTFIFTFYQGWTGAICSFISRVCT